VLAIDIIKGIIPVAFIAPALGLTQPWALVIVSLVAVCGHNWTVFLQFKGGKGIATSLGVLIGLTIQIPGMREVVLATVGVWLTVFLLFGYVSLASMVAAVAMPVFMVTFNAPFPVTAMSIILCIFIVFRHRTNIKRLLQGKENRVIIFKKSSP
jgi:glycerol-3-phosphate acyltransferase PlsY